MTHIRQERWLAFLIILPSIILLAVFVYRFYCFGQPGSPYRSGMELRQTIPGSDSITINSFFFSEGSISARRFSIDLWNTFFFTLFFLGLCMVIGLLLAILLDQNIKGESIFSNYLSFSHGPIICGYRGGVALDFYPGAGSRLRGVNILLHTLGLDALRWSWYVDTRSIGPFHLALIPVIIAAAWQLTGYTMVMYLAGLRGISNDLREAARVMGQRVSDLPPGYSAYATAYYLEYLDYSRPHFT